MKNTIFLILLLLCTHNLYSQRLYPLRSSTDSIRFTVGASEGRLSLEIKTPLQNIKGGPFPALSTIRLDDSDLVLDYQPGRRKKQFGYDVRVELLPAGQRAARPAPGQATESIPDANSDTKEWRWLDATESILDYGQPYTLVFHKSLLGEVDCQGERPAFGFKKQWPHYLTAASGLASLGLGAYYQQEKENRYREYRGLWANGSSEGNAQHSFDEAQEHRRKAEDYTLAGLIIIGADALFFAYRWWNIRKSQRVYDQYCGEGEGLSWQLCPRIELGTGNTNATTVGLRFQIQF